jgi:hypothetical protein
MFPSLKDAAAHFETEFPNIPVKHSLSRLIEKKGKGFLTESYIRNVWFKMEQERIPPKKPPTEEPRQASRKEECQPPEPEDIPGPEAAAKWAELRAQMIISPAVGLSLASIAVKKTIRPPTEDEIKEEQERRRILVAQAEELKTKPNQEE